MKHNSSFHSLIAESGLVDENGAMIEFNENTSTIYKDCYALAEFSGVGVCNSKEDIQSCVESFMTLDADQLNNAQYTRSYRELADEFARTLNIAITNLQGVRSEVEEMLSRYEYFRNHAISSNPVLAKSVEHHQEVPLMMKKLDWKELEDISTYVVMAKVNNKIDKDANNTPSMEDYDRLLNLLPFAHKYNTIDFNKLSLSDEAYNHIITVLENNSGLDKETCCMVLNTMNSFNPQFCRVAISFCSDFCRNDSSKIEKALEMVKTWNAAIPVLSSQELLDLSNSTMSAMMERVNCISEIIDFLAFTCIDYRQNRWNKALVVPGPMINSDNYAEFEQAGGNMSQICKYVNYVHSEIRVPNAGISNEHLFNEFHRIEETIDQEIAKQEESISSQIHGIELTAFNIVAHEWVKKHPEVFARMNREDVDKFINIINDGKGGADLKSYKLILNSMYLNTDTQVLYNELSNAYAAYVEEHKTLTDDAIAEIDCGVYAKIISDKLLDSGLLK